MEENNTSNKIRYDFGGISFSLAGLSDGRGALANYSVIGSCMKTGSHLFVGAIAYDNANYEISARIEVYQNGQLLQQVPLTHSPHGEIWPTGSKSLGGASIELPSSGKVEVKFTSIGQHYTGINYNSVKYESIVYSN